MQLRFGRYVHPIYREQLYAEPPGWRYQSDHPALLDAAGGTKFIVERSERFARAKGVSESIAMRVLSETGYVHCIRARPQPGVALIHAAERLLWRSPIPYVVDFEHAELFVLYQRAALERPWARWALEALLTDERLRCLLAWSEAAATSMLKVVSPRARDAVREKLRVVTPAIRPAVERVPDRPTGPLRVAFVGTKFYEKGGVEAVRAVQQVRKTHDVTLELISYVPDEWRRALDGESGVTIREPGRREVVESLYARSDVLLFPSHMDTFGWVVCEAMAHGLPVLAPDHLALRETITHEVSGLLFPPERMLYRGDTSCAFRHVLPPPRFFLEKLRSPSAEYVDGLARSLARMAEDRDLHGRLARGALLSVVEGPLAMSRRRDALASVYAAAAA